MNEDVIPLRGLPPPGSILVGTDIERMVTEAIGALAAQGDIFQRGNQLVTVVRDEPKTWGINRPAAVLRLHPCDEHFIHERLSRVQWVSVDGRGGTRIVKPQLDIARKVMSRGTWKDVRPITQVVEAATMRPDGTILSELGFDEATGTYVVGGPAVDVPAAPTLDDARRAAALLLDVLTDFNTTPAGRSAWLACLISVVVRVAIDGPVPMLIVSGTTAGTGKGLSTDALSLVAVGSPAPKAVYSGGDKETRKLITAVVEVGDPLLVLDNVDVELGDAALDKALTDLIWTDRILGKSKRISAPMRLVLLATGNNIAFRSDLRRRGLFMQLEATMEHPEERTGFKYPRLLDHVRSQRAALLSAALTIPRAYVVAGRPDMKLRPMGSYEAWSDLVRNSLVWSGLPDPVETVADLRAADTRTDSLRAMMAGWPVPDREVVTAADLIAHATPGSAWRAALVDWCPPKGAAELPDARALGNAIRSIRRRIVNGWTIDSPGRNKLGVQWMRMRAGDSAHVVHLSATPPHGSRSTGEEYQPDTSDAQLHQREPGEDDDLSGGQP